MAKLILQNQTEPASPDAWCTTLYIDSDWKLKYKDANWTVYRLTTNRDCIIWDLLLVWGWWWRWCYLYCWSSTSPYWNWYWWWAGWCVSENCWIFLPNSACVIIWQWWQKAESPSWCYGDRDRNWCSWWATSFWTYTVGWWAGWIWWTWWTWVCWGWSWWSWWWANWTAWYCSNITIDWQFCTFAWWWGWYKYCSTSSSGCAWTANLWYYCYWVWWWWSNNIENWHNWVVILRYATSVPICATWWTITCCNWYVVHTFTEDWMFCITCVY